MSNKDFVRPVGARPSANSGRRGPSVKRENDSHHFINISVSGVGDTQQKPGLVDQGSGGMVSAGDPGSSRVKTAAELLPLLPLLRDEGTARFRWRKRGRLTNSLSAVLGIGGETSSQDVAGWFRRHYGAEAGVVWTRTLMPNLPKPKDVTEEVHDDSVRVVCAVEDLVEGGAPEDEFAPIDISCLNLGGTCVVVCPQLVAYLGSYAALRSRSVSLMNSLRARALSWIRDHQVAWESAMEFLPGSIAVATRLSLQEKASLEFLGESDFSAFQHVNDLGQGIVRRHETRPAWAKWLPGKIFDYVTFHCL